MNRDYHKILGVDEKATQAEIKKAYQRKANKMHPDKGGDKDEFQKLQQAYSVLSDQKKRAEYEETGDVKQDVSVEMQAYSEIAAVFSQIIDAYKSSIRRIDIVAKAVELINKSIGEHKQEIKTHESRIDAFEKLKPLMVKDSKGIFSNVCDMKIEQVRSTIEKLNNNIEVGEKMKEILKEFKYNKEVQEAIGSIRGFDLSFTATSA